MFTQKLNWKQLFNDKTSKVVMNKSIKQLYKDIERCKGNCLIVMDQSYADKIVDNQPIQDELRKAGFKVEHQPQMGPFWESLTISWNDDASR